MNPVDPLRGSPSTYAPCAPLARQVRLVTSRIKAGEVQEMRAWTIVISNMRNPTNELAFRIGAEVTVLRLRYMGLHWAGPAGGM